MNRDNAASKKDHGLSTTIMMVVDAVIKIMVMVIMPLIVIGAIIWSLLY